MVEIRIKDIERKVMRQTSRREVVKDELNRLLKFSLLPRTDVAGDLKEVGVGIHAEQRFMLISFGYGHKNSQAPYSTFVPYLYE